MTIAPEDRIGSLPRNADFDEAIVSHQAYNIHVLAQSMKTPTLRLFHQYLSTIRSNTPPSDPDYQRLDLMSMSVQSELGMPQRVADMEAERMAAPPPPPDPFDLPYGGLILDDFERDLASAVTKHGMDVRCRMHDYRLAKFMAGVLVALADAQGATTIVEQPRDDEFDY